MFIEFTFGNFRSFRDTTTLSMVAAKLKSKYANLDSDNVFETAGGLKLLRSKAIYGANASGKSNVAKAISRFLHILNRNISDDKIVSWVWEDRFKLVSKNSIAEPILFQYSFLFKGREFRYGFEILNGRIKSEWLFTRQKNQDIHLFIKEGLEFHEFNENLFKEAIPYMQNASKGKGQLYRPDSLFLLAVAVNGGNFAQSLLDAIVSHLIVNGLNDEELHADVVKRMKNSPSCKKDLVQLLSNADISITDIITKEIDNATFQEALKLIPSELVNLEDENIISHLTTIESVREIKDKAGEVVGKITAEFKEWESAGTQKFFYVGALILTALKEGRPFMIDEFDARLHPRLSQKMVDLFNNSETNPHGAQLIFITHDVGLLKPYKLRRDQIAFVDKDKDGSSTLTTLAEFKGVRNDASYDKEYMQGAYGGVPNVNGLESIVTQSVNPNEQQTD